MIHGCRERKPSFSDRSSSLLLFSTQPSFNGALATEDQQYRVVINTVIALSASCVIAFVAVVYFSKEAKFDMVSIQNATLAGGVAVGSSSDLVIQPYGALIVGLVAYVVIFFILLCWPRCCRVTDLNFLYLNLSCFLFFFFFSVDLSPSSVTKKFNLGWPALLVLMIRVG